MVLGDSISDGFNTTLNGNKRWPDALASRIVGTAPHLGDPGVLNEGLSGNQITDAGASSRWAPTRWPASTRDVYGQTGVRSVIVELGINDLQIAGHPADRIIGGLRQLVAQLEEKGLRVLVCTLGPFEGFPSWTPEQGGDPACRQRLDSRRNRPRGGHGRSCFATRPRRRKVKAEFDSGDHIHPNDVGSAAVAAAVPLWLL